MSDSEDRQLAAQAQALLAAIVSSSDDAIVSKTLEGVITSWNDSAEHLYGYTSQEAVGQSITLIIPIDRLDEEREILSRIRRGERIAHFETVRQTKDGRMVDVSLSVSPVFGADGRIMGASKICRDITAARELVRARQRAEEAASSAQQLLRLITDNLPVLIAFVDADLHYRLNNLAYESWFGRPRAEITGKAVSEVLGPEAWATVRGYMEAALRGEVVSFEHEQTYPEAGRRWVQTSYVPQRNADGHVEGLAVMVTDITARRRAEEVLRQSEERLAQAVQVAGIGVFDQDHATNTLHWSPMMCQIHDWPTDLSPNPEQIARTLHPDDRPAYAAAFEAALSPRGDGRFASEHRLVRRNGGIRWISTRAQTFFEGEGEQRRAVRTVGAELDITDRKVGEQALRESRDVLSFAMRGGRMGAWSRVMATNRVWWSRELEELFGLAPGGFEGTHDGYMAQVHEDDRAMVSATVEQALQTRQDYAMEFRFRHAKGGWRWMEGRGRATYDNEGRPVMLYGLGIDITERKAAQAIVQRHAAIFEHQTDAIIVTDLEGLILDYNPAAERMLGYTQAEVLGRSMALLHRPEDAPTLTRQGLDAVRQVGEWRAELTFVRKDGRQGLCDCILKPLKDANGQVIGTVSVNRDITERRRTEDELRRLNDRLSETDRRKDEFLATLAHELRNPLAPIRTALEVLRLQAGQDDKTLQPREIIERQVRQMTRLVDDLLDVARITSGKAVLRRERTELAAIMASVLEAAGPFIDKAGHTLRVDLPDQAIWLDVDPVRLTQVVVNLLNNAATYTPAGGRIELRVAPVGDEAVITVRDTGMGIAPEHLAGIFDMFSQVSPALERPNGGLGIGLALVRGLVELHGGQVRAYSAGLGQGSTFEVSLKLACDAVDVERESFQAPRDACGSATAQAPATAGPRDLRILIVDDNRDAADTLCMMLTLSGHEVRTAHDGHAAVEAAASFRPDAALLDIGLPGLNGYEVAQHIRRLDHGPGMVLMAVTGWGQADDKQRARDAGFDHHLTKPVDPAQIESILRRLGDAGQTGTR